MDKTKNPFPSSRKEERAKAEAKATEHIKHKHAKVERIFLRTVYWEEDTWILQGEVKFKRAYFFNIDKIFKIKINPKNTTVKSYEEHSISRHKLK